VIGKDVAFPLLQAIAGLPKEAFRQHLVYLQDAEFVYETARFPTLAYTFKHVLTQEVAYESLLQSTRQQIHQRIAVELVQRFPETAESQPELLAHHFTEGGLGEQAIGYWQRAGQRANERSAHAEAVVRLTKGLAVLHSLPDSPEHSEQDLALQIALGTSLTATKGWAAPEVEGVYTRARELCQHIGETPQLGPVRGLWHFHAVRGEPQTARELGEQFLGLAQRAGDPARLLAAHFVLGGALLMRCANFVENPMPSMPMPKRPWPCVPSRNLPITWPGERLCRAGQWPKRMTGRQGSPGCVRGCQPCELQGQGCDSHIIWRCWLRRAAKPSALRKD